MIALAEHPALHLPLRGIGQPMTDDYRLAVTLTHLLSLDRTAVYQIVGNSTVVYYDSRHGVPMPEGGCCRIVLAPDGKHRRIGPVGFDPRREPPEALTVYPNGHVGVRGGADA